MSMNLIDQQRPITVAEHLRRFWTGIFSTGIKNAREATGRSIEEAARLAGMELSEWMAMEAGSWLPQTTNQLMAIAGVIEMDYDAMVNFVLLCWSAWES